jgi:hypothetical protein
MQKFAVTKIEEMLARMESGLKTRGNPVITKELVFNRVRVLQSEGYADDVAFAVALKDFRFTV